MHDVSPSDAARALAGLARRDARGMSTEADVEAIARDCRCVRVSAPGGSAVLALIERNNVLWVEAAQADGPSVRLTDAMDEALSTSGARSIAFMTERQGLVRLAVAKGYRVAGYVMKKDL